MTFDAFLLGTLDACSALEIIGGRALEIIGGRRLGTSCDAATLDASTCDAATLDASTLDGATLDASTLDASTLDATSSTACFGGMIGGRADIYYFLYFFVGDSSLHNQNIKWFAPTSIDGAKRSSRLMGSAWITT